jgi:hypothetical protein
LPVPCQRAAMNGAQLMVIFFWAVALAVVYIVLTEGES